MMIFKRIKELEGENNTLNTTVRMLYERIEMLEGRMEKIGRRIYELSQMEVNASFQKMADDFKAGPLGFETKSSAKPFCWNHSHGLPCPICEKNSKEESK